jgi:hypothetical protein
VRLSLKNELKPKDWVHMAQWQTTCLASSRPEVQSQAPKEEDEEEGDRGGGEGKEEGKRKK